MKHILARAGGVSGLIITVLAACLVGWIGRSIIQIFQPETTAAEQFLAALRDDANHDAFSMLTIPQQQQHESSLGFKAAVDAEQIRPASWRILDHYTVMDNQGSGPQIGVVRGEVRFQNGDQGTFRIDMVKVRFAWRVEAFRLERAATPTT